MYTIWILILKKINKLKIIFTTSWYSKTGNSSLFGGPNCFLTAVYLIAIGTAFVMYATHILTILNLPTDKLPNEAPINTNFTFQ